MTRAEEAQSHVLTALRNHRLPWDFLPAALATPEVSAARVSHALSALRKRRVICAWRYRRFEATRWNVICINPETQWKSR